MYPRKHKYLTSSSKKYVYKNRYNIEGVDAIEYCKQHNR